MTAEPVVHRPPLAGGLDDAAPTAAGSVLAELLRRGNEEAVGLFYDSRSVAVRAYCVIACRPGERAAATGEAFVEFLAALRADERIGDDALDEVLLEAARAAAARHGDDGVGKQADRLRRAEAAFWEPPERRPWTRARETVLAAAAAARTAEDAEPVVEREPEPVVEREREPVVPEPDPEPAVAHEPEPAVAHEPEPAPVFAGAHRRRTPVGVLLTIGLVVGVLLVLEATVTVVWQEPFTAFLADRAQASLSHQLDALERSPQPADVALRRAELLVAHIRDRQRRIAGRMAAFARSFGAHTAPGRPLGRVSIDRLGVHFVVVQGTDSASLRKGPGHYVETVMPGQTGTVGLAGHRTTYLAPFRHIDALRSGDRIVLTMPYGRFTYRVTSRRIVSPKDNAAFRPTGRPRLVLSACHPLFSASQRIIVTAALAANEPLGDAARDVYARPVHRPRARPRHAKPAPPVLHRTLRIGTRGGDVRALQRFLGVRPSGTFGPATAAAVRRFQARHGIPSTGVVATLTRAALRRHR
jgi:sortase A